MPENFSPHSYTADTPRMDEAEANGWVLREARIIERELGHYTDLARKHGWSEAHPRSVYLFISDALKRCDGPSQREAELVDLLRRWHTQGRISTGAEDEMPPMLMEATVTAIRRHDAAEPVFPPNQGSNDFDK